MTAGPVVAIEIDAVAWDVTTGRAVGRRRVEFGGPLERAAVQALVETRFGAPLGTAHSSGAPGDTPIGWTYPIEAHPELGAQHPGAELLVIPYACFADGTRRELLLHADHRASPSPSPSPSQRTRLEHESLHLRRTDRAGVTLELGRWLRRLLADGHTYLVIEVGDRHRYVQFATHCGEWLRGEVVGPAHLPFHPLSPEEEFSILDIGWLPPSEEEDGGNFWMEWGDPDVGIPVDVADAAELAAATLCVAFGPFEPHEAVVRAGPAFPDASE